MTNEQDSGLEFLSSSKIHRAWKQRGNCYHNFVSEQLDQVFFKMQHDTWVCVIQIHFCLVMTEEQSLLLRYHRVTNLIKIIVLGVNLRNGRRQRNKPHSSQNLISVVLGVNLPYQYHTNRNTLFSNKTTTTGISMTNNSTMDHGYGMVLPFVLVVTVCYSIVLINLLPYTAQPTFKLLDSLTI